MRTPILVLLPLLATPAVAQTKSLTPKSTITTVASPHPGGPPLTELVSFHPLGGSYLRDVESVSLSADGRYAVYQADGAEVAQSSDEIFLFDRKTKTTVQLATDSAFDPRISPDGGTVVYWRAGLTPAISVMDLVHAPGAEVPIAFDDPAFPSGLPDVSECGRIVVFESRTTHTAHPDSNGFGGVDGSGRDIYLFDRATASMELVSVTPAGTTGDGESMFARVSRNGEHVVFLSEATDLDPTTSDVNGQPDIYVRNRTTGTTVRISHQPLTGGSTAQYPPTISDDGRFVAFTSTGQLDPAHPPHLSVAFLCDRDPDGNGTYDEGNSVLTAVSLAADGTVVSGLEPKISGDAKYVSFSTTAAKLHVTGMWHLYRRELATGTTERITVSTGGADGNSHSGAWMTDWISADISGNGQSVAFLSRASNLDPADANGFTHDAFVRDVIPNPALGPSGPILVPAMVCPAY